MKAFYSLSLLVRVIVLLGFANGMFALSFQAASADEVKGRLKHDLLVGANHDIPLKTNQVVQVIKNSGSKAVIMVQMADGSNGIYQIDATEIEVIPLNPLPSTSSPVVTPPAVTNAQSTKPSASISTTNSPVIPGGTPSPAKPDITPNYPDDFVGGAEVTTTAGVRGAGGASVVKLADGFQAYVVSARHLLGKLGGFDKETLASDVPSFVKSIKIYGFKGGNRSYGVTPLLVNSTRLEPIGGAPIDDLTIYRLNDSSPQDQAVELADKVPDKGTTVYLIAHVAGGVPEGQRVHTMKVFDNRTWLEGVFDNDAIITSGASGAPVLNADGKCIGVYSGHDLIDGHMHAFIVPSPLIISSIKSAPAPAQ